MTARIRSMREMISLGTMMMRDAPARPGMGTVLASLFVSLVVGAMLAPSAAHAQLQFIDPSSSVQATTSGWINTAKSIAQGIWGTLIVIEFIFFGIQFGLFRDNFTEMFGSMALKIITTGFFLWLIQNADTLLPAVINSFTKSAQQISGNGGGSALATLTLEIVGALVAIYTGASVSLGKQELLSLFAAPFALGYGFAGEANSTPIANEISILLMQLISFLLVGALAVIILQWALTNIESYIVISAGIVFLGFTGSRWTLPFAQGYMSYAINVGAKLFTLYLILAVEANLGINVLAPVAGAAVVIGVDPTGVAGPAAIALLVVAAANCMIMSALAWYIPNIAGSFLSGQSSLSASSVMGSMASAISGIAVADAQKKQGGNAHKQEEHLNKQGAAMNALGGAGSHGHGHGGADVGSASSVPTPFEASAPATGNGAANVTAPSNATPGNANHTGGYGVTLLNAGGSSSPPAPAGHTTAATGSPASGSPLTGTSPNETPANGSTNHGPPTVAAALPSGGAPQNGAPNAETYSSPPAVSGGTPGSSSPPPATPFATNNKQAQQQAQAPTGGTGAMATGGSSLKSRSPEQLAQLSPTDGRAAVGRESIEALTQEQWDAIPSETRQAMQDEVALQAAQQRASEEMSQAYAMQSLASALPRGDAAPAAVQVRLSSPDKL